ncbi:hypothetical protein AB395_00005020 (plasmid) [Sinorhizobium fredii CCBAU 45436]|nr:hypothetical protein AB395_00005020 [Sinorhizobium fredii CCBAU 45436]
MPAGLSEESFHDYMRSARMDTAFIAADAVNTDGLGGSSQRIPAAIGQDFAAALERCS